ncbi:Hypothetical protein HVR_LOCUS518 [uncultured virus]|nr:Hypothetical protein HVR_LOCUS518 [uncultured virus]
MNVFESIKELPEGRVVTIKIRNKRLTEFFCRCSLYTYFGNYNSYYDIYYDKESEDCEFLEEILNIIKRKNGNQIIQKYLVERPETYNYQ